MKELFNNIEENNKFKLLINGEWVFSKNNEFLKVINPYNQKIVSRVSSADEKDANECINSAVKAKKVMKNLSPDKRYEILMKTANLLNEYREDFIDIIIKEGGKPLHWVEGEIHATIKKIRYTAFEARNMDGRYIPDDSEDRICLVINEPVGVVLAIGPFNYPLFTVASKICAAIAGGNSVIAKPSSDDPTCLLMLGKLLEKAGIPRGGINIITGKGSTIGDLLVEDKRVDMVSFTGSSNVGKHIASISGMKKLILELGGKCPALIMKDADVELAAKKCVKGCFKISGQRCDAISRVLIIDDLVPEFLEYVKKELKNWKTGNPEKEDVKIGPLINKDALENVKKLVDDAVSKGAKVIKSGEINGLFYPPTILDKVKNDMLIADEEIFGPVMVIIRVSNEEEMISIAKNNRYALDSCIFTNDLNKAFKTAMKLDEGMVHLNSEPSHSYAKFPFGGNKDSGLYREGFKETIKQMIKKKTIVLNL